MNETKTSAPGVDWTKLLTDPDIISHLGELLQAYRDAEPARRDQALRDTMRKIKIEAAKVQPAASSPKVSLEPSVPTAPAATPPFEPDLFTPCWGQDRRRYPLGQAGIERRGRRRLEAELGIAGICHGHLGACRHRHGGNCAFAAAGQ